MSQLRSDLEAAEALLRGGLTHGAYARNERGGIVPILSMRAACFCPVGALKRVCGLQAANLPRLEAAVNALRRQLGIRERGLGQAGEDIEDWWDRGGTKNELWAAFSRAIAEAAP